MQDIVMKDYPKTLLIVFTAAKVIPLKAISCHLQVLNRIAILYKVANIFS